MLQPWYAKLYKNEAYGPVKLKYSFSVETLPEGELILAAERPEYFRITLNGKELVHNEADGFWIDSCLKILRIPAGYVKTGDNEIVAETEFRRTTNIESMYLIGRFGVKKGLYSSTLTTLPEKLGFGNMEEYSLPFYTGCVTYKLGKLRKPKDGEHVFISVPEYVGSLAKVTPSEDPNDPEKRIIGWDPFEADVTDWVNEGRDIFVTLVCSRKNMFGPLHEIPAVTGAVGPGDFVTGGDRWSDEYVLMDSRIGKIKASWRKITGEK